MRFLAAAEILETDLWQQYTELALGNESFQEALEVLDEDMPTYVNQNTRVEFSHQDFINAYLVSKGRRPVNLEPFRTLPSSQATGSNKAAKRLTNLTNLTVDTSWYLRYRSTQNPDLGATFPQAVTIRNQPAIPVSDADTPPNMKAPAPPKNRKEKRMQAIANTAGFHFTFIEQGGASLYSTMALKASSPEVLQIVVSIGGVEVNHFAVWHDKAGNGVAQPLAPLTDPETHVRFPDLNAHGGEATQTNLIFPEPCQFISKDLPACSVIRPTLDQNAGAVAAVKALTDDQLFKGQSPQFFSTLMGLATAADAAQRQVA